MFRLQSRGSIVDIGFLDRASGFEVNLKDHFSFVSKDHENYDWWFVKRTPREKFYV